MWSSKLEIDKQDSGQEETSLKGEVGRSRWHNGLPWEVGPGSPPPQSRTLTSMAGQAQARKVHLMGFEFAGLLNEASLPLGGHDANISLTGSSCLWLKTSGVTQTPWEE